MVKRYVDLEHFYEDLDNEGITDDEFNDLDPEDLALILPPKPPRKQDNGKKKKTG